MRVVSREVKSVKSEGKSSPRRLLNREVSGSGAGDEAESEEFRPKSVLRKLRKPGFGGYSAVNTGSLGKAG